jgi:hypothetical protein
LAVHAAKFGEIDFWDVALKQKGETTIKLNSLRKLVGGLGGLRILFKEVLQQTPPELADEWGYLGKLPLDICHA